ncbi:probable ribosome production factor 1 [Tribolium castaneum]|uniref:Putative ribosome production factor 1-like Protein n=1 Tax=Tribolium castaneum TaxID=7070 RepID=D6WGH3_TRICA|nr:PREDICTED: probable ribosome production factor 1 [Tribolium castaneum]EFA00559.1 putative ribosome production factor 1-like Protein [Tribolium castaneum]|eukprot:XP_969832.1 PREDICTED: probable ribosome production factor 1 [Tribolium castaneum]
MSAEEEHVQVEDKPEVKTELKPSKSGSVLFPNENKYSHIKNKLVRTQQYQKAKKEQKKAKKLAKKEREREGGAKKVPHTLETLRLKDETTVEDVNTEENELVRNDFDNDEFSEYYQQSYEPKVLITYSDNPLRKTRIFGRELTRIIPNSVSLYRNRSGVKKIIKSATKRNYTDILVINENRHEPDGLLVIHLPNGPTAHFKLSNVKITTELRKNHKDINDHRPEVILNNFSTRLGLTIGRMLGALFHYEPEFVGRRAVTFHNQRDYIFFRHYRYEFDKDGKKARLKELGPRFTLKLRSLQKGTFDSKYGQYEWIIEGRRHAMETSRRKFFL